MTTDMKTVPSLTGREPRYMVLMTGLKDALSTVVMDLSPFRQNIEKNRNRQKYLHSLKEHPKFTKIAKFGCEML